jgi:hypothetical protein
MQAAEKHVEIQIIYDAQGESKLLRQTSKSSSHQNKEKKNS